MVIKSPPLKAAKPTPPAVPKPAPKKTVKWLSRKAAIELCGNISSKSFDRWRLSPDFPAALKASKKSRSVFFDPDELTEWLSNVKRRA